MNVNITVEWMRHAAISAPWFSVRRRAGISRTGIKIAEVFGLMIEAVPAFRSE
jgi:hypothetical protein